MIRAVKKMSEGGSRKRVGRAVPELALLLSEHAQTGEAAILCFVKLFLKQHLLAWNSIYSWGLPWIPGSASTSQVLGLWEVWTLLFLGSSLGLCAWHSGTLIPSLLDFLKTISKFSLSWFAISTAQKKNYSVRKKVKIIGISRLQEEIGTSYFCLAPNLIQGYV